MRVKLGMLRGRWVQVREKKKGWLKVEEKGYQVKEGEVDCPRNNKLSHFLRTPESIAGPRN